MINVIQPSVRVWTNLSRERCTEMMTLLERAGRVCYQSEPKGDPDKFISGIVKRGHESVLEHCTITVSVITSRAIANEMVRHRIAAYSQESTRFIDYENGIDFIMPVEYLEPGNNERYQAWLAVMSCSATNYNRIRALGGKPQEARGVLPLDLKTELVATHDIREWRHIFKLRCDKAAAPGIRQIMIPLLQYLQFKLPTLFSDIMYDHDFYNMHKNALASIVKEDFVCCTLPALNETTSSDTIEMTTNDESPVIQKNNIKYVAQLKMRCTYDGDENKFRVLKSCTTGLKLFNIPADMDYVAVPYTIIRDSVYLTAIIPSTSSTSISEVMLMAKESFKHSLIEWERLDLIPYMDRIFTERGNQ